MADAKKVVLSVKPDRYLSQGLSNCGLFSIKGILSAYGLDHKEDPREYHSNLFGRLTSITFGRNYYKDILESYGMDSEMRFAENLKDEARLDLLKELLSKDKPVMIRIGNGYFKSNKYNPILGKLIPHLITLWGYDDEKRIFYVYDSGLTPDLYDKNIPIGNTKRTYEEMLRDWNFGKIQPWAWVVTGPHNFAYTEIKGAKNGRS